MRQFSIKEDEFEEALMGMIFRLCYNGTKLCEDNSWDHINKMNNCIMDAEDLVEYIKQEHAKRI